MYFQSDRIINKLNKLRCINNVAEEIYISVCRSLEKEMRQLLEVQKVIKEDYNKGWIVFSTSG